MFVGGGGDDIFWFKSCIFVEENMRQGRLEGGVIQDGEVLFVEFNFQVVFNLGESVILVDGNDYVIGFYKFIGFVSGDQFVVVVFIVFGVYFFEDNVFELILFYYEGFRWYVVEDWNVFFLGIFNFLGGGFYIFKWVVYYYFYFIFV